MHKSAYWCVICIYAAVSLSLVAHFLSSSERYLTIFNYLYHAVAKETEFNLWGFIFIMLAAVMAGFRWSMTQILLQVCYCIYY
jgi:hypothetical protein